MKNSERPVYPLQGNGYPSHESVIKKDTMIGLTKREYFAAKAMSAMIANPNIKRPSDKKTLDKDLKAFSAVAVEYADALLRALEEQSYDTDEADVMSSRVSGLLPIGTKVKIKNNNDYYGDSANTVKEITGYREWNKNPKGGYELDGDKKSLWINEDFEALAQ